MEHTQRGRTAQFFLIVLLGALNTITPFSIDMYLPGFPQIAADLHTTVGKVALSVSTYFLGFAAGQLLYGPLLDRFGRKKPLYIGLSLYILSCIACILSPTIELFFAARFIQAFTGCVAAVAAMAMVRDFFPASQSAKIISLLVLILGVSPLLAPTAGSLVVDALGWRWVFAFLAMIVLVVLLVTIWFLPEGHRPDPTVSLLPADIIGGFKTILRNKTFIVYALAGTFSFAGLFVYVAGSPAIFMDGFGVSAKVYGAIFAFLSVGFIGGSQLNHLLNKYFRNEQVFLVGVLVQVTAAIIFFAGVYRNYWALPATLACLFVLLLCAGLTYPNAAAIALAPFTTTAGSAAAMLGCIQIGIGGLISSGAGLLQMKGSMPAAVTMLFSSLLALLILSAGSKAARLAKPGAA